jgi:hypothetical protein
VLAGLCCGAAHGSAVVEHRLALQTLTQVYFSAAMLTRYGALVLSYVNQAAAATDHSTRTTLDDGPR